jgi:hypothetical protein
VVAGVSLRFGRTPVIALVVEASAPLTKTHYDAVIDQHRQILGRASPLVPTAAIDLGF